MRNGYAPEGCRRRRPNFASRPRHPPPRLGGRATLRVLPPSVAPSYHESSCPAVTASWLAWCGGAPGARQRGRPGQPARSITPVADAAAAWLRPRMAQFAAIQRSHPHSRTPCPRQASGAGSTLSLARYERSGRCDRPGRQSLQDRRREVRQGRAGRALREHLLRPHHPARRQGSAGAAPVAGAGPPHPNRALPTRTASSGMFIGPCYAGRTSRSTRQRPPRSGPPCASHGSAARASALSRFTAKPTRSSRPGPSDCRPSRRRTGAVAGRSYRWSGADGRRACTGRRDGEMSASGRFPWR